MKLYPMKQPQRRFALSLGKAAALGLLLCLAAALAYGAGIWSFGPGTR